MVESGGARVMPRTRIAALVLGVLAALVAMALWNATPAGAEVDSDGDGVVDSEDAFPADPSRAVSCPIGFYGAFDCTAAPPGTYVDTVGALAPTPCPLGAYQQGSAFPFCNLASPGTYVDSVGSVAATPCPVGTFQPLAGAVSCNLAPPGTFVSSVGAVAATRCDLGTFQPLAGAVSCDLAPVGTYVDVVGAVAPIPCPSGTTTAALGSTSSADCVPVAAVPSSKQDCKRNGWRSLTDTDGRAFRNQGDCVSFVATQGRNPAAA